MTADGHSNFVIDTVLGGIAESARLARLDAATLPPVGETKLRAIRMSDDLWEATQARANAASTDASKIVRGLLEAWLNPPVLTDKQQSQFDKGVAAGRAQVLAEIQDLVNRETASDD